MYSLNEEQRNGLEVMKKGFNCFLTGQAGTGKSYTLTKFVQYCIQNNIKYAITSTTGVSALLINGTTIHSWAGILLGMEDKFTLLERVYSRDKPYRRWLYTKVLIIDEISMMSPELLEKLDYIGKKVRKNTKPFGGIQLIFTGDMAQLPPVKSDYSFKSPIWVTLIQKNIYLTQNMRQTDPIFQQVLKEVRMGKVSQKSLNILQERVGAYINAPEGIIPTKLFSHRATVANINRGNLLKLVTPTNKLISYVAEDDVKKKNGGIINYKYRENYLKRADKIFQAEKILEICIGAQVMLLFNLDVPGGLANGSRGLVISFKNNLPIVRFMNGIETAIDYNTWNMKIADDVIITRRQIPLMLAWAVTIHKSQGSTVNCASIDLGDTIFLYGQAYTALSRCKNLEYISIINLDPNKLVANPDVVDFYGKMEHIDTSNNNQPNNSDGSCNICCERDTNTVLLPCGHVCSCMECSYNLEKCPICRSDINSRNKIYLS